MPTFVLPVKLRLMLHVSFRFLVLFIIAFTADLHAQPKGPLKQILDITLQTMEQNSMYKNEVNWEDFKKMAYRKTHGISDLDALLLTYPDFFKALNDFHGGIQYKSQFITWHAGKPVATPNPAIDSALQSEPKIMARRWGDIVYYRVLGATTKNLPYVTQMLSDTLCTVEPATAKGWILDLRLNTGGNVWFNLASLAGLIGNGNIGGFVTSDATINTTHEIRNGKAYGNGQYYEVPSPRCATPGSSVPVVLLTGPHTASSAEALLLAFKGRDNTLVIGEATAGFVTSNNTYPLGEDLTLVLATGFMKDKFNHVYRGPIEPDVIIKGGDNFKQLENDLKIIKALAWLSEYK